MFEADQVDFTSLRAWILSDGKAGHVNQSVGVAEALGLSYEVIPLKPKRFGKLISWIDPFLGDKTLFPPDVPDFVFAAGNGTVAIHRALKLRYPHLFSVQMMRPRGGTFPFDVVAVPAHDGLAETDRVVTTTGAPNKVTAQGLAEAVKDWSDRFKPLGKRKLGVLVGGASKHAGFTVDDAKALALGVLSLKKAGGFGLMVTTSRRTGAAQTALLQELLGGENVFFWDGQGNNPYLAILGAADALVVTADSVSMVSEGCTAGKPVHVFGLSKFTKGKFYRFYDMLTAQGRIAPLGTALFEAPALPLADAQKVAGFIRGRYLRHRLQFPQK